MVVKVANALGFEYFSVRKGKTLNTYGQLPPVMSLLIYYLEILKPLEPDSKWMSDITLF